MARRSRVTGVNTLRRKLRRMEPDVQRGIQNAVADVANRIQRDAMSMAPVDEGDLRESIDIKYGRDKLTALIGPGIKAAELVRKATGSVFGQTIKSGKKQGQKFTLSNRSGTGRHAYWQMLKGYWIEFGTKGNAKKNIPPQPARPFMSRAYLRNRTWAIRRVRDAVNRALERAARG